MKFLIDYNLKGKSLIIWGVVAAEGWLELIEIKFLQFEDVGLPRDSSDLLVWNFAQQNQMILITANRNMKGKTSLEQTIREKNTDFSLPVVTISNVDRLDEKVYREKCVASLIEVGLDIDNYLGAGRVFIP
jgi:predicted nuclease of predicted toxin-antitoxin system